MYDNGKTVPVDGLKGGAMSRTESFNEATQMLSIPNRHAGAFQPGDNDFSFMVCFRVDEHPDLTSYSGIIGYAAGNQYHPGYDLVMRKSEPMQLLFYMAEGRQPNSRNLVGTAEKGKWLLVICSVDRDGQTRTWIDGKEGERFASPHPGSHIYHEHANYGIFQRFSAYPRASVDFAAVWDRALSPAEALWLSNQGSGRTYAELKSFKP
jgi:hypothetical protein